MSCLQRRGLQMRRREFIGFVGGAVSAWPFGAFAQQRDQLRRIGVLMGFAETDEVWQTYLRAFRERLRDFGWIEGQNVKFEYRFAGESVERTRQAAAELVASKPDLLFVTTNPALSALLKETHTIPIVFTWVSDSVGSGYVSSLAHPGGNVTGFHNFEPAVGGKWLGVLKQIAPQVHRVGFVHVPEIAANVAFIRVADSISKSLGMSVSGLGVRDAGDFERVLTDFAQAGNGGLIITPSPLTATKRDVLIAVAEKLKLPTVYSFRFYVESGGLVSYGIDQLETVREAASYVDRILRGANPADLPVQLPTKFSLVVNLKTAKGLGLTVPESFLLFADEVIE
jgi:putative tryptophan/tyrosine transport system substrate-binding protein